MGTTMAECGKRTWLAFLLFALLFTPLTAWARELRSGARVPINYLPQAALVDQCDKPVSFSALKGQALLVGFIHASCEGICEMLTAKMVNIGKQLDSALGNSVMMVTVTTDPVKVRWTRSLRQRSGDSKVENPALVRLSLCL